MARRARALWIPLGLVAAPTAYLTTALLVAAGRPRRTDAGAPPSAPLRFLVVIPAHDEEAGIGATLQSLADLDHPRDRYEVLVVADNCSDRTAQIAREAGATVLERDEPEVIGTPAVLAWTAQRLPAWSSFDAVAVVDADCRVSPNLLQALGARLAAGAGAAQARYVVSNPGASWLTSLRTVAFVLDNHVKPLARDRLGLSCGLFGTGMAFRADVVARLPWEAFRLTEDYEYHLQLVEAGERAAYAPEATVASPMPTSLAASHSQHARWEAGRRELIRAYVPRMLRRGVRQRDPLLIGAAVDRLIPPLTFLTPATALLAAVPGDAARRRAAQALLAAQAAYVLGGLALARAPAVVWASLVTAPGLVAWKLALRVEQAAGRSPTAWLRTARG